MQMNKNDIDKYIEKCKLWITRSFMSLGADNKEISFGRVQKQVDKELK